MLGTHFRALAPDPKDAEKRRGESSARHKEIANKTPGVVTGFFKIQTNTPPKRESVIRDVETTCTFDLPSEFIAPPPDSSLAADSYFLLHRSFCPGG